MSAVYSRLCLKCSGVRRGLLSACKWIFCVHRFCEDCLLAALTVSAVPAVIDEPGGTLHPRLQEREREGEDCCSIISHDLTRLIMPPQIPACHYADKSRLICINALNDHICSSRCGGGSEAVSRSPTPTRPRPERLNGRCRKSLADATIANPRWMRWISTAG